MGKGALSVLLICSLLGCSWSIKDKRLLALNYGLLAADSLQSYAIVNSSSYVELNPIISGLASKGSYLVFGYFAIVGLGIYLIADYLSPVNRTRFLGAAAAVSGAAVTHNVLNGVY